MAAFPAYASTPKVGIVTISTANTLRDGTGTIGTVFTAGTSGSRIDKVVIMATDTTTAGMIRLFIHNGTSAYLLDEIPVIAVTPSTTQPAFSANITLDGGICIPTGYSLRASTNNAESFNIYALGGDF